MGEITAREGTGMAKAAILGQCPGKDSQRRGHLSKGWKEMKIHAGNRVGETRHSPQGAVILGVGVTPG